MASTGGRAFLAVSILFSSSVGSVNSGSGTVNGSTGPRCWYGSRMSRASGGCKGLKILLRINVRPRENRYHSRRVFAGVGDDDTLSAGVRLDEVCHVIHVSLASVRKTAKAPATLTSMMTQQSSRLLCLDTSSKLINFCPPACLVPGNDSGSTPRSSSRTGREVYTMPWGQLCPIRAVDASESCH